MTHDKKDTDNSHSAESLRLDRLFARCGSPLRLSTPEVAREDALKTEGMAQEQDSAVRSREMQVSDLVEKLCDGMCREDSEEDAPMIIDEAMALGAAEKRRESAELRALLRELRSEFIKGVTQTITLDGGANIGSHHHPLWIRIAEALK